MGTETMNAEDTSQTKTPVQQVLIELSEKINSSGSLVKQKFLEYLVNQEIDDRVSLLVEVLQKKSDAEREVKKANKPDVRTRNADGTVLQESFSEDAYKKLSEAKKKLERIDAAMDLALDKNDYSKLKELK